MYKKTFTLIIMVYLKYLSTGIQVYIYGTKRIYDKISEFRIKLNCTHQITTP